MDLSDIFSQNFTSIKSGMLLKMVLTLIILLAIWFIRFLVIRIIMKHTEDVRIRYIWQKTLRYTSLALSIIIIVALWLEGFRNFTTFIALFSAGVAIALRDIIANVAGWFFIIWVRPITIGDRIELGASKGDVVDISMFHITVMEIGNWVESDQSTGRVINIPNGKIFTEALANYSQGFHYIWNEIPVLVTFESDWEKAKEILMKIAQKNSESVSEKAAEHMKESSKRYMINYSNLTPTVYTNVKDSGVLLTVRYLCKPRRRRTTQEAIWEEILRGFNAHDNINLAYPTVRYFKA